MTPAAASPPDVDALLAPFASGAERSAERRDAALVSQARELTAHVRRIETTALEGGATPLAAAITDLIAALNGKGMALVRQVAGRFSRELDVVPGLRADLIAAATGELTPQVLAGRRRLPVATVWPMATGAACVTEVQEATLSSATLMALARSYLDAGERDLAMDYFDEALQMDPTNLALHKAASAALLAQHDGGRLALWAARAAVCPMEIRLVWQVALAQTHTWD